MPFYTFKCPTCSVVEEVNQGMNKPAPKCKKCDTHSVGIHIPIMERVWQPTGKPKFKGSGFYETDYKRKKG
jgi:predicted nucleic acid-binding Zn ribbon protein